MNWTPESYAVRVAEWMREDEAAAWSFPKRTLAERGQRYIGSAEAAVLRLLSESRPTHPILSVWIHLLTTDAAFADRPPFSEDAQAWRKMGGCIDHGWGFDAKDGLIYPFDNDPRFERLDREAKQRDAIIYRLADVLCDHRLQGEDGQDSYLEVGGMTVTTNLAAAIFEYHTATGDWWANRLNESWKMLRDSRD